MVLAENIGVGAIPCRLGDRCLSLYLCLEEKLCQHYHELTTDIILVFLHYLGDHAQSEIYQYCPKIKQE